MTPIPPHLDSEETFEAALTRALEHRADPKIPSSFAARVAASLPSQRPARVPLHAGRSLSIVGAIVLAVALFALAPHAAPSFTSLVFDVELLLLAQLAFVAWLLVPSRHL